MSRDDPGHLFSKVAKFVRNPLRDWSALDAQETVVPAGGYSREVLKAMIERRQRNDFVRRREFDMLRKLRQRESAGEGGSVSFLTSSFNLSVLGQSDGRALTLKKIDEIEEQMSQQWWKGRPPPTKPDDEGYKATDFPASTDMMSVQRARAYADTVPAGAPPTAIDGSLLPLFGAPKAGLVTVMGVHPSRLLVDTGIEEAAICFARGDEAGSETVLLQTISPGNPGADHDDSWRALFDLYRATGQVEKFEHARLRYLQRFGRPGPPWVSLRLLARDTLAAVAQPRPVLPAITAVPDDGWTCPTHLTREGLGELMRVLGAAGPVWVLDWRALVSIDSLAVAPLKSLFVHWASTATQLRFAGGATLQAVLAAATPSGDRRTAVVWWELRMSVLRAMHEPDNFEFVALKYCLTYEVSPPPWQEPQCRFSSSGPSLADVSHGAGGRTLSTIRGVSPDPGSSQPDPRQAMLAGDIRGASLAVWSRLDADLAESGSAVISCAALLRMDFAAAGALLEWVVARDARSGRVEFVHAHRLVAAFFKVIGIADHATITARKN